MIRKTFKHFGAFGLILAAALFIAPATMQAQDGHWGRRDYSHQQRDWDRHNRNEWREQRHADRNWRAWERDRDWRRQSWRNDWRNDRWNRRYRRGYIPGNSFYFGYRY